MIHSFSEINWFSVIFATLISFPLGALWHSKLLFGNAWLSDNKLTVEQARKINPAKVFGLTAVFHFVGLICMDALIGVDASWLEGLLVGALLSVFVVMTFVGTYLFASRPTRLLIIDASYYVIVLLISGIILGVW